MTGDLGHPLQFGVALYGHADNAGAAVALAEKAEQLGLDVVAVEAVDTSDAVALDAWTLVSWIAGKTTRIGLRVDGLDVDVLTASVIAGAASSLDLLSGGRAEIALVSASHDTEALAEADEVLRALWDAGDPTPATTYGGRHHVTGAARGPAPVRDVAVWVTGTTPQEAALAGGLADGWTSSVPALTETLTSAAHDVGRDPREIRRSVVLTLDEATDSTRLTERALTEGIGTFLIATADTEALTRFATTTAPAVREAAAGARLTSGTTAGTFRRADVRAARRAGIAYDHVPADLARTALEPGDGRYDTVRSTYMRGGTPGLVLRPRSSDEVASALGFAGRQGVPLSIRSGGHGISGRSTNDGGVVVDLSALNQIEVLDADAGLVRVGAGARWGEVARALQSYGLAITSGDSGGVGVGGLATAGGIGLFAREQGLTIDRIRSIDVATVDGSLRTTDATHDPELFWGMRGAGSALAVATSFVIEAAPVGNVGFARLVFEVSDVAGFLQHFSNIVTASPRDLTMFVSMGGSQPGRPSYAQVYGVVDSPDPDIIIDRLQPLAAIAPLAQQQVVLTPYVGVVTAPGSEGQQGQGEPAARSGLTGPLTPEVASAAADFLSTGSTYFFQLRSVGGAVTDIAPDATAYAHRGASFSVVAFGGEQQHLDNVWDRTLAPHSDGFYWSFSTDRRPERLIEAYPPATLERLRALKATYDPENLLRDNLDLYVSEAAVGG